MELLRIAGTGMILVSSFWAGLHAALSLRRTHARLCDLQAALTQMAGEIQFAATPLGPLCRRVAAGKEAAVEGFFLALAASEEAAQWAPQATRRALAQAGLQLPEQAVQALERVFDAPGATDREGQARLLTLAGEELRRLKEELSEGMEGRCRSYQLLGLTAGAAVLVLVI